ncbi:MAG: plasmid mobilization relaxosome protein MobC [Acutalibacteraceae bacterium]|nr:plasmid mobilization relaxosome protein MobC [Acutalibacteraceae bacterium]
MGERYRKTPILFWVTDEEKQQIESRMELVGSSNMSAYLRKMALDGYVINLNVPELDETISLLRYSSNNINQIAKRVNATGVIFKNEIDEIQKSQSELWCMLDKIIAKFSKIK